MNLLKNIFKRTDIQYDELINSEEYFNSIWRIRYIESHDGFALYNRNADSYLDLRSDTYFLWKPDNGYFKDCITSSKLNIINKFKETINKYKSDTLKLSDEKILDEIDIKTIEQYLRKKKLNKLT